jgi:cysteine desulfuration protein SufE
MPGSAHAPRKVEQTALIPYLKGMDAVQTLIEDFELLDDWEERYRHVIELGRALPPLPETARTPANKVMGCASQVWIDSKPGARDGKTVIDYAGDSDALIVKGLIAIAFMLFSGKTPQEILAVDAGAVFEKLGLREHLTQQRSNGFASMVARIKSDAHQAPPA